MFVCVYVLARMHGYTHARTHTRTHIHKNTHTRTRTHTHTLSLSLSLLSCLRVSAIDLESGHIYIKSADNSAWIVPPDVLPQLLSSGDITITARPKEEGEVEEDGEAWRGGKGAGEGGDGVGGSAGYVSVGGEEAESCGGGKDEEKSDEREEGKRDLLDDTREGAAGGEQAVGERGGEEGEDKEGEGGAEGRGGEEAGDVEGGGEEPGGEGGRDGGGGVGGEGAGTKASRANEHGEKANDAVPHVGGEAGEEDVTDAIQPSSSKVEAEVLE